MTMTELNTMNSIQHLSNRICEVELRDYFAIQVLNGILANSSNIGIEMQDKVKIAYEYADEMILQRRV